MIIDFTDTETMRKNSDGMKALNARVLVRTSLNLLGKRH
jgi:hypothetical protein